MPASEGTNVVAGHFLATAATCNWVIVKAGKGLVHCSDRGWATRRPSAQFDAVFSLGSAGSCLLGIRMPMPGLHAWPGVAACMAWGCCMHGLGLLHAWPAVAACMAWVCCMHGLGLLHAWPGVAACMAWGCCMYGLGLLHARPGVAACTAGLRRR
eukprot:365160-Chlamydomonas_euryale.AAC.8